MVALNSAALARVEHIVVVMLENRSFDHMLGYLALDGQGLPDHGELPAEVNGLAPGRSNTFEGKEYTQAPLAEAVLAKRRVDLPHDADSVRHAIEGNMGGFVGAFAKKVRSDKRTAALLAGDPGLLRVPMQYLTADHVPVYDHLARNFCVCDNWNCSMPGPTLPNRFFAVAGTTDGYNDNGKLLLHRFRKFESFFRHLKPEHDWRWYSSDPAILRAVDGMYSFDNSGDHFAYVEERTELQPRSFLRDVLGDDEAEPDLPAVSWVDPNFAMKFMLPSWAAWIWGDGPGSNDDHPPAPAMLGQRLVNQIYEALRRSRYAESTLLLIVYDEHGGFYDHEPPPPERGPRVPALVVSPLVKRGVCSERFEHASIAKTILLRFGVDGSWDTAMGPRVRDARDLSVVLRDDSPIAMPPVPDPPPEAAVGDEDLKAVLLPGGGSRVEHALELADTLITDLQYDFIHGIALPLRSGVRSIRAAVRFPWLRKPLLIWRTIRNRLFPPRKRVEPRRP
jgi:phospholipase C